jgi:hypothetical protein
MSYNQNFSFETLLDNVEKNYTSVSRFIQPECLRSYVDAVTEANIALTRTAIAEVEKTLPTKQS